MYDISQEMEPQAFNSLNDAGTKLQTLVRSTSKLNGIRQEQLQLMKQIKYLRENRSREVRLRRLHESNLSLY